MYPEFQSSKTEATLLNSGDNLGFKLSELPRKKPTPEWISEYREQHPHSGQDFAASTKVETRPILSEVQEFMRIGEGVVSFRRDAERNQDVYEAGESFEGQDYIDFIGGGQHDEHAA